MEIKIYKQRVKHLLYEQQDDVTAKKLSAEVSLKLAQVRATLWSVGNRCHFALVALSWFAGGAVMTTV